MDSLNKFIEENDIDISHFNSKKKNYCKCCGKEVPLRNTYCDNVCKGEYEYQEYIDRWKRGLESGTVSGTNTSERVRKYLFRKYNNSC